MTDEERRKHIKSVYPFVDEDDIMFMMRETGYTKEEVEDVIKKDQKIALDPGPIHICLHCDDGTIMTFTSENFDKLTPEDVKSILDANKE